MTSNKQLDDNRFFDPDPTTRGIARELYGAVRDLPLVCPHGHVDPAVFARNEPFENPSALILTPDHYILRMLYSRGVEPESLGVPARDGAPVEKDPRKAWQVFGDNYYLFAGTPTAAWLAHVFSEVFGIDERMNGENALAVYDAIDNKLKEPAFLPRALFERFRIEVLTTTDGAADPLDLHEKIRRSGWPGRVVPCFRPDAVIDISHPGWKSEIEALGKAVGMEITSYRKFIGALEDRRKFFRSMGALSTDQAVLFPYTAELSPSAVEDLFGKALKRKTTPNDAALFTAHMLMEMARMSIDDGLVMQIHPGSYRNHNRTVFERFGPDMGGDIPVMTEYTRNLHALLNSYGNDPRLTLVVFTLDEAAYSRELAPLAGHYPAMKLGPPWWFHDSMEGMVRFRRAVTETAGLWNTAGFNDDARSFPSIPARHDLARRVDSNYLAGLAVRHAVTMDDALAMGRAMACDLARETYRL